MSPRVTKAKPKAAPRPKKKVPAKRRPAQRRRAGAQPTSDHEVSRDVARAVEILMGRGVKGCLREKLPPGAVLIAAAEQVGLVASMLNLPYPQALQAACNGVESVYRVAAPEQVKADRPIAQMAQAMAMGDASLPKVAKNGCEHGEDPNIGLTNP